MRFIVFAILTWILFVFRLSAEEIQIQKQGYTSSLVCGQCHEAIYSKWKNSMHAMSYTDPIFELGYLRALNGIGEEARTICLNCHAPAVRYNQDVRLKDPVTREGVTCDFCHTIKGVDLDNKENAYIMDVGDVKRSTLKKAESPAHKVEHSELHAKSEFCAGCHDMKAENGLMIMGTYTEWKETSYAREGVQCQGCHMPVIEGKIVKSDIKESRDWINLHDLQGGHSVSQLAKAMKVEILDVISAPQGVNIKVGITNAGSGHFVPTGHPSRQLVLKLLVRDQKGQIVHQDEKIFKKTLVDKNGKELKYKHEFLKAQKVLTDNRIPPGKKQ